MSSKPSSSNNGRPGGRAVDQLRAISFERDYTRHAAGSVLTRFGDTVVLCTASISDGVPRFLKNSGKGWLTAEYGMLPGSTHTRVRREAVRGQQQGRTVEIQRLIGRSLRQAVNLKKLDGYTINIDCDVLQADGGTRTAAITGGCVALVDALRHLQREKKIKTDPFVGLLAAISVGVCNGQPILDLDYTEDFSAQTDMNVIMNEQGDFIELQGAAEKRPFSEDELTHMLAFAKKGVSALIAMQRAVLEFADDHPH